MQPISIFREGISVVVVNYQTSHDLKAFCGSYENFKTDQSELIIVNVDPLDRDIKVAENTGFSQHIVAKRNVGYARACNRAARQTNREVIAFFNADTRLTEKVLDECSRELLDHDDWGVLGPRQIDDQGRLTHAGWLGTEDSPIERGWGYMDDGQFSEVEEAVTVVGSALFVKRRVWDELTLCPLYREVAPFAEGAFLPTSHFYEDTFCSYHARAHGWKSIYYGPIQMVHKWHQASSRGGAADARLRKSKAYFRWACDAHGISHN